MPKKIYRSLDRVVGDALNCNLYLSYNYRLLLVLSRNNLWYPILMYVFLDDADEERFMKVTEIDFTAYHKLEDAITTALIKIAENNAADIDDIDYIHKLNSYG